MWVFASKKKSNILVLLASSTHFGSQNSIHYWAEKRNANTWYTQCMIVLKNRQIPQKSWSISSGAPPTIRYLKVVCEKSYFQLEMSKLQETKGFKPEWKLMHLVWIEKIWDGSFRRFANIVITLGKNFLALHLRTLLRTFVSEHPFETDNPLKLNPFVQKWKHSHVRLSSKQGRRT